MILLETVSMASLRNKKDFETGLLLSRSFRFKAYTVKRTSPLC